MRPTPILVFLALLSACASVPEPSAAVVDAPTAPAHAQEQTTIASGPHRDVVVKSDRDKPNFSPAIRTGNLLFMSGAVGLAPEGGKLVAGGIKAETKRSLERIEETLAKAGLGLGDVVKCTVYLADIAEFSAMNEIYREVWPAEPPTRTTVAVSGLAINSRVEIECIAAYAS